MFGLAVIKVTKFKKFSTISAECETISSLLTQPRESGILKNESKFLNIWNWDNLIIEDIVIVKSKQ